MIRVFAIAFALLVTPVAAQTPLKDVQRIQDGMIVLASGDMIRRNCGAISARMIRAYRYLKSLEAFALSQGYSETQIEAYTDNAIEKARLLGIARARLQDKGVNFDDPQTFCTVGRAEIGAGTPIGKLLRAN